MLKKLGTLDYKSFDFSQKKFKVILKVVYVPNSLPKSKRLGSITFLSSLLDILKDLLDQKNPQKFPDASGKPDV